jgi:hypothetical protein
VLIVFSSQIVAPELSPEFVDSGVVLPHILSLTVFPEPPHSLRVLVSCVRSLSVALNAAELYDKPKFLRFFAIRTSEDELMVAFKPISLSVFSA